MVLNHMIEGANSDHRNERVHNQKMSHAVIELFHWLYSMWHRLVETTYWLHQYHPISAERNVIMLRYRAPLTVAV